MEPNFYNLHKIWTFKALKIESFIPWYCEDFFFKKNLSHKTQEFIKIVTNIQQYCLMHAWNSEFKKNETEFPEQKFQNK